MYINVAKVRAGPVALSPRHRTASCDTLKLGHGHVLHLTPHFVIVLGGCLIVIVIIILFALFLLIVIATIF